LLKEYYQEMGLDLLGSFSYCGKKLKIERCFYSNREKFNEAIIGLKLDGVFVKVIGKRNWQDKVLLLLFKDDKSTIKKIESVSK